MVIYYQTTSGAFATIIKHKFPLMTYKDALTGRLKVDEKMTVRDLKQPKKGSKKLLIYAANMQPHNILSPTTCTSEASPRDKAA